VAIADYCRAVLDPFLTTAARAKTLAFQQSGEVTASWGEVKNRADLIIYWRCQPTSSPRFRERYGDLATGEFVQPNDRTVFVVDTDTDFADWETPSTLTGAKDSGSDKRSEPEYRGRVHGINIGENDRLTLEELIEASVESHSNQAVRHSPNGTPHAPSWWPIHEALSQARYATIVVGHLQSGPGSDDLHSLVSIYQLMQKWAAHWNANRRCVVVPFPGTTNHCRTAQTVLTWRTGYPMSVDFSAGYPRYDVISNSWRELIERHDVDLVVLFSGEPESPSNQSAWKSAYHDLERWARENPLWEVGVTPVIPSAGRFLSTLAGRGDEPERRRTIGRPDGVLLPYSAYPTPTQNREIEVIEKLWSMLQC
jgi:formylmethanofuran dehydrogenase subunit B